METEISKFDKIPKGKIIKIKMLEKKKGKYGEYWIIEYDKKLYYSSNQLLKSVNFSKNKETRILIRETPDEYKNIKYHKVQWLDI